MKKNYLIILLSALSITSSAQIVNIPDANFKAELLNYVPVIDINGDNEIQVSEALTVTQLFATSANIADLTGIEAFTNLTFINVVGNNLTTVNLNGLVNLTGFNADSNQVTSVNLGNVNTLDFLSLVDNQLTSLDLSGRSIDNLYCQNNLLTSINLNNASIREIRCQNNQLTQLDLSDLAQLNELYCMDNQITSLDFSANEFLLTVNCTSNPITQLDFSQNPNIFEVLCFNPLLQSINLKNGANGAVSLNMLGDASSLRFVCADTEDVVYMDNLFDAFSLPLVNVSSYCSFSPGGKFNTITGTCRHDLGNDGCAPTDPKLANLRLNLTNAVGGGGSVFTDQFGKYKFFTSIGDFTVVPVPESNYFTFSPASPTISFVNDNHNITVQDFCLVAAGLFQDLEITMVSNSPARPGFNADYVIFYKNKGTETMTGTVNLQFNDNLLDFVLALPNATTQASGSIDWAFTNLAPFETRTITVTLNVNAPTDTPPVNINDQLDFVATVFPIVGDETPADNAFGLRQFAVGSFDPNDITCLEGATIGVEQVGEYLHYLIRFQNSGNFYAENVVVKNIINEANFDLSTFEIVGTSHPQETRLTDNKLEFIFEGINLPAEIDDEPGSHGYIAYKIKTINGLGIGDSVAQSAEIFFDFNFPIITNNAITTVTALGTRQFEGSVVAIYPNPVKNIVTVTSNDILKIVSLYDVQGRLLQTQKVENQNFTFDISDKRSGIYLLKVETASGIKTERLIKE